MKRFLLLGLIPFLTFAQNIEELNQKIKAGEIENVRNLLPSLIAKNPDNPELLYLSGLVETDGEKALLTYRDVISRFSNSSVADDAFLKIVEYLFTKGLYAKTDKYARELIKTYPRSNLIDKAIYLHLCSLNAMHQRDSVDYYYRYYSTRYPGMDFHFENYRSATKLTLADISQSQTAAKPPTSVSTSAPKQAEVKKPAGDYMLQMGVFGNLNNANSLKKKLERLGHTVTLRKVDRSGRTLTSVLIGSYLTEGEARRVGDNLKKTQNLDFVVVKN